MGATHENFRNRGADSASDVLLRWYDLHHRRLPWRVGPGADGPADPYHVWLSEIMLQQTTVVVVDQYFRRFVKRWPTVDGLARADLGVVLEMWAGLGYYARARNLHRCARYVSHELDGVFPAAADELLNLPGIGPYTAAAIAAIAFGRPATVVDGNVERVMARLYGVETPLPAGKAALRRHAEAMTPMGRPGDYAQAVMDLGATVCTPRRPKCGVCPWAQICQGRGREDVESLPRRPVKKRRPVRVGTAYWAMRQDGRVLIRRRPPRGLLGGMMEFPGGGWDGHMEAVPPVDAEWRQLPGGVRHTFTHFHLELTVMVAEVGAGSDAVSNAEGSWVAVEALGDKALPSVMQKVARHAMAHFR